MRAHLAAYLVGRESLGALADWGANLPVEEIDAGGDETAREMLYALQLHLAELADGILSETGLRDALRPFVVTTVLSLELGSETPIVHVLSLSRGRRPTVHDSL